MKITFFVLVTTFVASIALSQENAKTAGVSASKLTISASKLTTVGTFASQAGPKTYLVQANGVTLAILPPDPKRELSIECSGDATYDKGTGTLNFTKAVKLVASVPDQAALTITGENLTLLPQG